MSGLPAWARVGAKVVYLGAIKRGRLHIGLERGGVYTIRDIMVDPETGNRGLLLAEVRNILHPRLRVELGYGPSRFRPAVSLDDDMAAHFDHLLHLSDFHPEPV